MAMNKGRPSWTWLDVIFVYVGIIVLSLLWGIYGGSVMNYLYGLGMPDTALAQFTTSYMLQFIVTVGLVLLLSGVGRGTSWQEIGFAPLSGRNLIRYGVLGGLLLLSIIVILSFPLLLLNPDLPPQSYEQMLRTVQDGSQFLLLLIMAAVLAPLSEELFYRGMIYPVLRKYLGPAGGAVLAGILFGLAHYDLWRTIPLAIGGMVLCWIYEKTGSILPAMIAHGVWNGIMSVLVYASLGGA